MTEARWRHVLSRVRQQLAVGGDGFPAYLLKQATPEVQGLYLDALRDVVLTMDVPAEWSECRPPLAAADAARRRSAPERRRLAGPALRCRRRLRRPGLAGRHSRWLGAPHPSWAERARARAGRAPPRRLGSRPSRTGMRAGGLLLAGDCP